MSACSSHCWQNEKVDGCCYGPSHACGAMPKVWPHPTYDEDGHNVWVSRSGVVTPRNGNQKWGPKIVYFVHPSNPDGFVYKQHEKWVPKWAVVVNYDVEKEEIV